MESKPSLLKNSRRDKQDIYLCLPPDRIWHKVFFYSGGLEEGKVGLKLRLMPTWTILVIGSLGAMWTMQAFVKSPCTKPNDLAGHNLNKSWRSTAIDSLPTQRWSSHSLRPFDLKSIIDFDAPLG